MRNSWHAEMIGQDTLAWRSSCCRTLSAGLSLSQPRLQLGHLAARQVTARVPGGGQLALRLLQPRLQLSRLLLERPLSLCRRLDLVTARSALETIA